MGKPIVYIDGREGTTGLQIYDRLAAREDVRLLLIEEEKLSLIHISEPTRPY